MAIKGYRYLMGLHFGLCHGPVDTIGQLLVDERQAWAGEVTSNTSIPINQPNLFGGEDKEGGVQGFLDICMGADSQVANDYLVAKLPGNVPAYRGILSAVWRGGMVSCNNPYIKPWKFRVKRILAGWGTPVWNSSFATIGSNGDMNPAHIIYQCITNPRWGMGYPTSAIDVASFTNAAQTLYDEGCGISLKWNREVPIAEFMQLVMDHIAGVFGVRNDTGKFVLRLIRQDYDVGTLPVFGPSEIIDVPSIQKSTWGETVNELTVIYTDPETGKDAPVAVQDLANIATQGRVVATTKRYPGIRDRTLATRVAQRDLNATTLPISRASIRATRKMNKLYPGAVFKLNWPKEGFDEVIMRVMKVGRGTLTDGELSIEAAEDIYGLPSSAYVTPEPVGWLDPLTAPAVATDRKVEEATRYELQQQMSPGDFATLTDDSGYLIAAAARPSLDSYDYSLWTRTGANAYQSVDTDAFAPKATLGSTITPAQTSFSVTNQTDTAEFTLGSFAQIDDELMRIDSINLTTGAMVVGRGVLDTVAAAHASGSRVLFRGGFQSFDPAQKVTAEVWDAKLTPRTGRGQLAIDLAPADTVTFAQRQFRPYPPGKFRINTEAYPVIAGAPLVIDWAHRDRLLQNLESEEQGDIGPEMGTTYNVRIYDADSALLLDSTTGETGVTWTSAVSGPQPLRVELESERATYVSRQKHNWGTIAFDGFVAGDRRITEAGDRRITEASDVRIIE